MQLKPSHLFHVICTTSFSMSSARPFSRGSAIIVILFLEFGTESEQKCVKHEQKWREETSLTGYWCCISVCALRHGQKKKKRTTCSNITPCGKGSVMLPHILTQKWHFNKSLAHWIAPSQALLILIGCCVTVFNIHVLFIGRFGEALKRGGFHHGLAKGYHRIGYLE